MHVALVCPDYPYICTQSSYQGFQDSRKHLPGVAILHSGTIDQLFIFANAILISFFVWLFYTLILFTKACPGGGIILNTKYITCYRHGSIFHV